MRVSKTFFAWVFARLRAGGMKVPLAFAVAALAYVAAAFHFFARPHLATIGMVGFVIILVTAVLSPTGFCGIPLLVLIPAAAIGIVLCIVGVFDVPRWPAIAGLIAAALCIGFWGSFFGWAIYQWHAQASKFGLTMTEHTQTCMEAMGLFETAESQRLPTGAPAPAVSLTLLSAGDQSDPWSHPYRYVLNNTPRGYTFMSDGPDGVPNTSDDIDLSLLTIDGTFSLPTPGSIPRARAGPVLVPATPSPTPAAAPTPAARK